MICTAVDTEKREFLEQLLAEGSLSDTAAGVAKLVMAKGENVLSAKQWTVYEKHVLGDYPEMTCRLCQLPIPLNETVTARHWNEGYCASCANAVSKMN